MKKDAKGAKAAHQKAIAVAKQAARTAKSKLTRLLEDSLSGAAVTTMVCACSPAAAVFDETLQTLQRAHEVKQMKRPTVAPPVRAYMAPPAPAPPPAQPAQPVLSGYARRPSAEAGAAAAEPVPPLRGLRRVLRASHECDALLPPPAASTKLKLVRRGRKEVYNCFF